MTVLQVKKKIKAAKNVWEFQDLFFSDDGNGNMTPDFQLVYKTNGGYSVNEKAAIYNSSGSCTNSYIKCEDGFVEYPF